LGKRKPLNFALKQVEIFRVSSTALTAKKYEIDLRAKSITKLRSSFHVPLLNQKASRTSSELLLA
jgi:hypothetical protein